MTLISRGLLGTPPYPGVRIFLLVLTFSITPVIKAADTTRLTAKQQAWLMQQGAVRRTADTNWPPFEFRNKEGEFVGMCMDYFNLVVNRLNLQVEMIPGFTWIEALQSVQRKELDIVTCLDKTAHRETYLAFTEPFTTIPQVIITRSDYAYISGLMDLSLKKVAMIKGYVVTDVLSR